MSEITLKIDKGNSSAFSKIMELLQSFPGLKECRKHYSVKCIFRRIPVQHFR